MTTGYANNPTNPDHLVMQELIRSITDEPLSKQELMTALSCIDLTALEGANTSDTITALSKKARLAGVAAVCVYPPLVNVAANALQDTVIKSASVAGGFPSGQLPLHLKLQEVTYALEEGATEIDFVISRNQFLQGNYQYTRDEVAAVKTLCGSITLKVILETGELETMEKISIASKLAIEGGADFIKTSTGKIAVNATPEAVCAMLMVIKKEYERTGKKIGIKPSGGIADGMTAATYLRLTERILGKEWLHPSLFRIGASRLVNNILMELNNLKQFNPKEKDGY